MQIAFFVLSILTLQNGDAFTVSPVRILRPFRTAKRLLPRADLLRLLSNLQSDDPFEILGIDPSADFNKNEIRRAYRRLALKYHPDVVTSPNSSDEERKKANDNFAKINGAYSMLSGKDGPPKSSTKTSSKTSSKSSSGSSSVPRPPPHRRQSSYQGSGTPVDWSDFMPKYDEDEYDTGGDSFGAIFSDILVGVAGGGKGVFQDFVQFLETNVDGYSGGGSSSDDPLKTMLRTGTLEEIGNEMDDTELVVQQLSSKLSNLDEELTMLQADLNVATRYSEKFEIETKVEELKARKKVVQGYLQKARKRLLSLQTRYKELIVGGANDPKAGGKSSRTTSSSSSWDTSTSSRNSGRSSTTDFSSTAKEESKPSDDDDGDDKEAWRSQGFGSSRRGRGSSRRRRGSASQDRSETRTSTEPSNTRFDNTSSNFGGGGGGGGSSNTGRQEARKMPTTSTESGSFSWKEPPHRRSSSSYGRNEDKRRMREIKVDEEFDKLKKELGL